MVVSEMGEQWSPNTLPARVADRQISTRLGSTAWATGTTMGIRMPKVPQAVPVEKLRKPATTKMMAGSRPPEMPPSATMVLTKSGVCSRSRHTPLMAQASTRMVLAGIMAFMPSPAQSMKDLRLMRPRGTNMKKATVSAPKEAQTRALEALQLPKAAARVW